MKANWQRFCLYAGLYFVQGSVLAFLGNFQKPFLLSRGVAVEKIGLLTSLLILPFILKIFFGFLSDRVPLLGLGYRKPYILLGLGLGAIAFVLAGNLDPATQFFSFGLFVFLASLGLALFDTAIDGYAIDVTKPGDQSLVQSMMVSGKALGYICMSVVFGRAAALWGYPMIYILLGGLVAIAAFAMFRLKEPKRASTTKALVTAEENDFSFCIGLPQLVFFVYAVAYSFISFGVDGLAPLFLLQVFGISEENLGAYGSMRGIGALFGAAVVAILARIIGLRWSAVVSLGLIGAGIFLWIQSVEINNFYVLAFIWGLAWASQETVFVALAMGIAKGPYAATVFAVLMMASNIGTSLGEFFATSWTAKTGFGDVYQRLAFGLPLVLGALLIYFWLDREKRLRF